MTAGQHIATELLIDLIEERLTADLQQEICSHVESCPECGVEIATLRELITELERPEVWGETTPEWTMAPESDASRRVAAMAARMEDEEKTARSVVSVLVDLPRAEWDEALRETLPYPTAGLVRTLLGFAHARLHNEPLTSLSLAETAGALALRIDPSAWDPITLSMLRASALKEQANALRMLGRYSGIPPLLDEAESILAHVPGSGLEAAAIDVIRGAALRDMGQLDTALELARSASETSLVYGDMNRYVQYRMLEAATLGAAGRPDDAREISLELLRIAERKGDRATIALLLGNIGTLSLRLEDPSTATIFLRKAADEYAAMDMSVPSIRMRWTLAALIARQNRHDEAEVKLAGIATAFAELGLAVEEALVRLDLAEVLLLQSQTEPVARICRQIVDLLQREGVTPGVMTALAYLREALELERIDLDTVRRTRSHLQEVPHQRPYLTLQPPALP